MNPNTDEGRKVEFTKCLSYTRPLFSVKTKLQNVGNNVTVFIGNTGARCTKVTCHVLVIIRKLTTPFQLQRFYSLDGDRKVMQVLSSYGLRKRLSCSV
jgi:hypothetical protein